MMTFNRLVLSMKMFVSTTINSWKTIQEHPLQPCLHQPLPSASTDMLTSITIFTTGQCSATSLGYKQGTARMVLKLLLCCCYGTDWRTNGQTPDSCRNPALQIHMICTQWQWYNLYNTGQYSVRDHNLRVYHKVAVVKELRLATMFCLWLASGKICK